MFRPRKIVLASDAESKGPDSLFRIGENDAVHDFHRSPRVAYSRHITTPHERQCVAHQFISAWGLMCSQKPIRRVRGGSGEVAVFRHTSAMRRLLKKYIHVWTCRVGEMLPTVGQTFVMKVITPLNTDEIDEFVHEALMHQTLADHTTSALGLHTSRTVPPFFFGAYDPFSGVYIIIMGHIPGKSVKEILAERRLTPSEFNSIEYAARTFWANGIIHGDLHVGNIIMMGARATFVDFALSFALPATKKPTSLEETRCPAWAERAMCHGDALYGNIFDWYNADPHILHQIRKYMESEPQPTSNVSSSSSNPSLSSSRHREDSEDDDQKVPSCRVSPPS